MPADEPLLLLAFNRPEHFIRLIDHLRPVAPSRIYIAVDGPRTGHPTDAERVQATRDAIGLIDWPAEIHTLIREENLGCGLGVSSAISWFFSQVERGIILEDDILPRPTFFEFCTELLDRHADDEEVFGISGCNFVPPEFISDPGPYRFSRIPHIWGWASWRRAWEPYSLDISGWQQRLSLRQLWALSGHSVGGTVFWKSIFDLMARGQVDTWDMQVVYMCMERGMMTATSNVNLVDNVGWGDAATHTFDRPAHVRPSADIELPTRAMPVIVDAKADAWSQEHVFGATTRGLVRQGIRYVKQKVRPRTSV